jgi:predicted nucleic acid-binding protein
VSAASFDSNILIDALNDISRAHVELERFQERWISRISWIEVMSKVDERTSEATRAYLGSFNIDELDTEISTRAALLRNARRSLRVGDAIILATALVRGRILVTRNTKDFPPNMPGIRVPYIL